MIRILLCFFGFHKVTILKTFASGSKKVHYTCCNMIDYDFSGDPKHSRSDSK